MPSAHRYSWQRADGSTGKAWRSKWAGPDGSVHYKRGFRTKGEAVAYANDREAEARHGVVLEPVTAGMSLAAWSQEWLASRRVRPSTEASYRYAVQRIVGGLGGRPLGALRKSELEAWRKSIDARMSASTAAHTAAILGMILRAAVEDDLIPKSPMPRQTGGTGTRQVDPDELLTVEQVRGWGAAMPACAREMPVLAAMTGLRQGELLGLRLPNVDFLRREVRVVEQLLTPVTGQPAWGPPKTPAGVRTVPLPEDAVEALARHLAAFPPVDGVVFRSPRGRLWRRQGFGDTWRAARDEAGLPAWAHWHGLRDLFASVLLRQGVDSPSLIAVMGHTSLAETKVYARLMPDSRDNVRRSVANAWKDEGQYGATGPVATGNRRSEGTP